MLVLKRIEKEATREVFPLTIFDLSETILDLKSISKFKLPEMLIFLIFENFSQIKKKYITDVLD